MEGLPGVDNAVDQAVRLDSFLRAHPQVSVVPPQHSASGEFAAMWADDGGVRVRASHFMLGRLLDYLEARFG